MSDYIKKQSSDKMCQIHEHMIFIREEYPVVTPNYFAGPSRLLRYSPHLEHLHRAAITLKSIPHYFSRISLLYGTP